MIITLHQQRLLLELALSQGEIIAQAYKNRRTLISEYKEDGCDFATETDQLVEKNLAAGILAIFPEAIIYGEEYGLSEGIADDRPIFYIDPIDGTKYFRYGMSFFTLSIGIRFAGKNIYGLILNPLTGDIIMGGMEYGISDHDGPLTAPPHGTLSHTQIYYDTVGIHSVSLANQDIGLEFIKNISLHTYRARSAGASCMFAFGAVNGLIGAMIDVFGGTKITDQVGFFAILSALGWEERRVTLGTIETTWLAPAPLLDELVLLIPHS